MRPTRIADAVAVPGCSFAVRILFCLCPAQGLSFRLFCACLLYPENLMQINARLSIIDCWLDNGAVAKDSGGISLHVTLVCSTENGHIVNLKPSPPTKIKGSSTQSLG